jgi:hypothetical protein
LHFRISSYQTMRRLLPEDFGASPAFVVELRRYYAGRISRTERGALNIYALSARLGLIQFSAKNSGDVLLEVG